MILPLTPGRGGYLRPFGTAIFIRDYLMARGPDYGVEVIDPDRGCRHNRHPLRLQASSSLRYG